MATFGCDLAPGGERYRKGHLSKRRGILRTWPVDAVSCIYTAGVKPGLTFGDTVVGMSDAKLKRARSAMLSWQVPRHAGVSLRAKT
eukprot:6581750-Pyramimonas_sp.AAC.1